MLGEGHKQACLKETEAEAALGLGLLGEVSLAFCDIIKGWLPEPAHWWTHFLKSAGQEKAVQD